VNAIHRQSSCSNNPSNSQLFMPTEGSGGLVSLLKYNYFVVSVCKMSLEDRYLILEKKRNRFYLCMYERPDWVPSF
jgi:hypothetical protein